ncbi:MAG TPA: sigma-70 family RNA polymerase sigma factor [Vicinamibacterales bacterium]|jgi:RNA polymerase sigma-70 factor (ECF subfamily)|nr:sigma-70 family RNA polymerase sigma factor [Vicinamibacterales bacterium]
MNRTEDRLLVARLQARDETAVHELAERFGSRIYQLALRQMKNREDAEEVTQDVLMKVYRKIGAFRGDSALSSWIYRITFNTAMSKLRSARLTRAAQQSETVRERENDGQRTLREPADWSSMPDEELLRAQLRRAVVVAIAELPEIYRVPVVLRDIEGLSTEEASTRLKVKDQTLKSRLHRGRLMLRERLQAFTTGLNMHRPTPAFSA